MPEQRRWIGACYKIFPGSKLQGREGERNVVEFDADDVLQFIPPQETLGAIRLQKPLIHLFDITDVLKAMPTAKFT